MIKLTKLNGAHFILNSEIVETIESTPDTVISTVNGKKFVVTEGVEEIIKKIIEYKNQVLLYDRINL